MLHSTFSKLLPTMLSVHVLPNYPHSPAAKTEVLSTLKATSREAVFVTAI